MKGAKVVSRSKRRRRALVASVGLTALFLLFALVAPYIAPYSPVEQNVFRANEGPSQQHLLGTDHFGRDTLSRLLHAARVSVLLGVTSPLLAGLVGTLVGAMSGYFGGSFDSLASRVTDVLMAFPTLLLGVLVAATLGPGFGTVVVALTVALVPRFVRLARSSTLAVRSQPYIEASRAMGQRSFFTILVHVVPNIMGPLIVMTTLWIATAIRLEASLSFLGLGTQAPFPSWGNMVREGLSNMFGSALPMVFAGLAITLTVLSFNVLGDDVRDALDPELQRDV